MTTDKEGKTDKAATQQLVDETKEVINKTPQNDMGGAGAGLTKDPPVDAPVDETVTANDDTDLGDGAGDADGNEEGTAAARANSGAYRTVTGNAPEGNAPETATDLGFGDNGAEMPEASVEAEGNELPDLNLTNEELGEQILSQARTRGVMNAEGNPVGTTPVPELTELQKAQIDSQTATDKYNALVEEYNALSPEEKNGEKGKALEKQAQEVLGDLTDAQAAIEAAKREEYVNTSPEVVAMEQSLNDMTERYNSLQQALEEIIGTKTKEDDEKTERDKWRTFWSGIGEIGSSLVNQMGVSGVFGGRNAYGRGAYSSMMKFNLTTKEFSDQADAAHEKRQKAIDDLEKQRLSLQEKIDLYLTQGAATLGQLKATRGDAYDKAKADAAKAERDYELALKKFDNDKEIAAIRAAGRGSRGSSESGSDKDVVNQAVSNAWGDSVTVTGNQTVIDNAIIRNAPNFANDIATQLGYNSYQKFEQDLKELNERICEEHNKKENPTHKWQKPKTWSANTHKLTVDEIVDYLMEKNNLGYDKGEVRQFVNALLSFRDINESQETKSIDEWQENLSPNYKGTTEQWAKDYGAWAKNYGEIIRSTVMGDQESPEIPKDPTEGGGKGDPNEGGGKGDPNEGGGKGDPNERKDKYGVDWE